MAAPLPSRDLLSSDALDRLFASLKSADAVLAAVSGGPDSMAMMHLLARWAAAGGRPPVLVATVDHRLRPEAAEEAAFVAKQAAALGLGHRTLVWEGEKPATGVQEAAREARYGLLVRCAKGEGASHLLTAHTQDDQAETLLMRLAAGSGLSGLSGMRRERDRQGIRHVRPLLDVPKSALVELCEEQGWPFVRDPSNENPAFARVRWRRIMPLLAGEGLTAERLVRLAERMRLADEALDAKAAEAFERAEPMSGQGEVAFKAIVLAEEPFEIALRVLERALAHIGLKNRRLHRLEACLERVREAIREGDVLHLTVAGAVVRLERSGRLVLRPEPPRRRGR